MLLYNLLRFLLYGIIFIVSIFYKPKKIRTFMKKRLFQNFEKNNFERVVLIHLSSVGEFNLSQQLIKEILNKNEKIIISVMTDTGFSAIQNVYGNNENVKIIYFPIDDYFVLKKLFKTYKIYKTIIIETEIWFNLYDFAKKNGELFIVNGRLTEKRMKSYLKIKYLMKKTLNKAKKIMVQSVEDKKRYEKLGVLNEKLKVYKNLKYSILYDIISENKKNEYFKNNLFEDKKIIVCGSTRPTEEKIWFEILKKINNFNNYQLIIVPRHLDRIIEIKKEFEAIFFNNLDKKNVTFSLLSENKKTDVLIVDKMGVLRDFYQIAHFVFVGGTLTDIGGHSILEPLYYGKLPIIGKYYQNIEDIVNEAKTLNFVKIVENNEEIIEYLQKDEIVNTKSFFEKNNNLEKIIKELYNM